VPSHSLKVAWKEDDVLKNRDFDYSKRFLPNQLAGVDEIACLDEDEKRKLNQVIGNASCHIFAFVEEFIVPQTLQEAQRDVYGEEERLRALLRFAEEEIKHQQMFRRSMATFEKGFGIVCGVIPGREDVPGSCGSSSPEPSMGYGMSRSPRVVLPDRGAAALGPPALDRIGLARIEVPHRLALPSG
jgi:hypothetical protein